MKHQKTIRRGGPNPNQFKSIGIWCLDFACPPFLCVEAGGEFKG
jgi:hypothetical protein